MTQNTGGGGGVVATGLATSLHPLSALAATGTTDLLRRETLRFQVKMPGYPFATEVQVRPPQEAVS